MPVYRKGRIKASFFQGVGGSGKDKLTENEKLRNNMRGCGRGSELQKERILKTKFLMQTGTAPGCAFAAK